MRVTLGNHEAIILSTDHFDFSHWYSGRVGPEGRQQLLSQIERGHVVAAYGGYNVTYAHAGLPDAYEPRDVNEEMVEAAARLSETTGTSEEVDIQRRVLADYPCVLGAGNPHPKGPGAGLAWFDFDHLPPDAPPQVVGHTQHRRPRQKGNVYCQNVLRENVESDGGEAVFVETSETLSSLVRRPDGETDLTELTLFNQH